MKRSSSRTAPGNSPAILPNKLAIDSHSRLRRRPLLYTRSIMEHARTEDNEIREISKEEGRGMLDAQTRKYLGISADEFIERWDSSHCDDPDDRTKNGPEVMALGMFIPFAR